LDHTSFFFTVLQVSVVFFFATVTDAFAPAFVHAAPAFAVAVAAVDDDP
jgi:hypothetical protein